MADYYLITFSANGTGVGLKTKFSSKHGDLCFKTEEFQLYQRLFKVIDNKNQGQLIKGSTQLNAVLIRTNLSYDKIGKLFYIAVSSIAYQDSTNTFLDFNRWLVLCKCIAFYQTYGKVPEKEAFKKLHADVNHITDFPIADFNLQRSLHKFLYGKYSKRFVTAITSWRNYEGHVKFNIATECSTLIEWEASSTGDAKKASFQADMNDSNEKCESERRYSDFEAFVAILQRHHNGYVIPPLPLKSWPFFSSETLHEQRRVELQMFLDDIIKHPILEYSFELKSFLECSSPGYKSFIELYASPNGIHGPNGLVIDGEESAISKLWNEGTVAMVTGANSVVANHKSLEYIQSIWGYVTKTVSSFISPNALSIANEHAEVYEKTSKYLEAIAMTGRKVESLISLENEYARELLEIGLCFKNMSEFESVPLLCRILRTSHTHIDIISSNQTSSLGKQNMSAQLPLQYTGRYVDSYRQSLACRTVAVDALQAANKHMYDAEVAERAAVNYLEGCRNGTVGLSPVGATGTAGSGVQQAASGLLSAAAATANKLAYVATNVAGAAAASLSSVKGADGVPVGAAAVAKVDDDDEFDGVQTGWNANLVDDASSQPGVARLTAQHRSDSFEMVEDDDCWGPVEPKGGDNGNGNIGSTDSSERSVSAVRAYGPGSSGVNKDNAVEHATEVVNAAKQTLFNCEEAFERAKADLEQISTTVCEESSHVVAVTKRHAEQALKSYIHERIRFARSSVEQWSSLRDALSQL